MTVQLAYTWSHEIDEVRGDLNGLSNPFNAKYDRGSGGTFDRRHIFNAELHLCASPSSRSSSNLAAREILGGWRILWGDSCGEWNASIY